MKQPRDMLSNYEILLQKIDKFIRKYYLNLLLKGFLLFGAGFFVLLLVFSSFEYVGYFTSTVRFILFYTFIAFNAFVLLRFVMIPLLGLLRIGKRIKPKEAAKILGNHFKSELHDKVVNALELQEYLEKNAESRDILLAGIDQKSAQASRFPFNTAIRLQGNYRYIPFFLVPVLILTTILLLKPAFLTEPTSRIVNYQTYYEKPAPFSIHMLNDAKAFKSEDLEIVLSVDGEVLPDKMIIRQQTSKFTAEKVQADRFRYVFRNVQQSFTFFVESAGFSFGPFTIDVVQKPAIAHFNVVVKNPPYTKLPDENIMNVGDLQVTEGAVIQWKFNTRGSGEIHFNIGEGQPVDVASTENGIYEVEVKALESFSYEVMAWNEEVGRGDSLTYNVYVRPDQYPRIQVDMYQDEVMVANLFHRGIIQDDYGFTALFLNYRVINELNSFDDNTAFTQLGIEIDRTLNNQNFYHHIDINSLGIEGGSNLEYYFNVLDNDAINGPKSSRSRTFSYYVPSQMELLSQSVKDNEAIQEELSGNLGELRESRNEIEQIRRQLLENERMTWEQQESVRNLLEKQQSMEENLDKLAEEKRKNEIKSEQFSETEERIREKQEELQKIFDEIVSDELKELFDKIREELDKLDRDEVYEMLSRMEFEMRNLENQMDRALELFKQLEMERILQESISLLEDIQEKQSELSQDTEESESSQQETNDQLSDRQEKLNEEFDELNQLMDALREKNEELMQPKSLDDTQDLEKDIKDDMKKAGESLRNNDPGDAGQQQNAAQKKMEELSERLNAMQEEMVMEQLAEDARVLREILENLLKTSFTQEDLLLEIRTINVNDPRYIAFIQTQRKLRDDLSMIEDSLVALSKRQIAIQSFVTREIGEINMNLDRAIMHLIERQRAQASSRQQFVMTHINNLALMLNESLQNMQMQMASASGQGQPQPGQGEPSFQKMRQMQEGLNQMLQQMQQGHQPMPGKAGEQPMSTSEALARMAAEQEAIRQQLQRMADRMRQDGQGESQEIIDLQRDMQQTELDIVRRQINRQTLLRQEQVLTRLLEHEKAERQQEMEERRVGNTAKSYELSNPAEIFEYNRIRNNEMEMLRSLPAGLAPYYRSLVENYFLHMEDK